MTTDAGRTLADVDEDLADQRIRLTMVEDHDVNAGNPIRRRIRELQRERDHLAATIPRPRPASR